MYRKAILIGVPNCAGQSELTGVNDDLRAFRTYLKRNESGAWEDNEIVTLVNKSKAQILAEIEKYSYCDYVILLAAGHGAVKESYNFDTVLCTGIDEYVSSRDLEIGCERQTIIMDVCRNIEYDISNRQKLSEEFNLKLKTVATFESISRSREEYKLFFNRKLLASPKAYFKFYSCDQDESASDKPSYTQALLESGLSRGTKSILKTHNDSISIVKSRNSKQNPQHDTGRTVESNTPIFSIGSDW